MGKINYYNSLLELSYDELVQSLLIKYGPVSDDYYRESSYVRFLMGEIKSITKGKYSRAKEGLYCHHIDENKYIDLSNQEAILRFEYPYYLQQKDRLVYCDLIEHYILHSLIINETHGEFGEGGFIFYIRPMVEEWFIKRKKPKPEWMKQCYKRAFLTPEQTKSLLKKIDNTILYEYNLQIQTEQKIRNEKEKQRQADYKKLVAVERKYKLEKDTEKFNLQYPELAKLNFSPATPRNKLLNYLYDLKYKNTFASKKDFRKSMLSLYREDILNEINTTINAQHNHKKSPESN